MEYRVLPHGVEQVSVIGMGSSVIGAQPEKEIIATVRAAVDSGVNYFDMAGRCVYCKHCHPCPAGLDVALINKYYDLAMQGDNLAREHYLTLEKWAGDCVGCGHCDSRCPFHVTQSQRMQTIQTYFGA